MTYMNNDDTILHWALDALVGTKGRGLSSSELSMKLTSIARAAVRRGEVDESIMTYSVRGRHWEITGTTVSRILSKATRTHPDLVLLFTSASRRYWGLQSEVAAVDAENKERAIRNQRVQILDRSDWSEDKAEVLVVLDDYVVARFAVSYTQFGEIHIRLSPEFARKQAEALARTLRQSL